MLSFLKLKGISKDYLEDKYFFFFDVEWISVVLALH